jgi:hypothetical protein
LEVTDRINLHQVGLRNAGCFDLAFPSRTQEYLAPGNRMPERYQVACFADDFERIPVSIDVNLFTQSVKIKDRRL